MITIWADEATAGALEALGRDFTTRRGVAVDVIELPFPSIRSDVLATVGTDDAPDVFIGAHSWTGSLRDAGATTPIRGIPQVQQDAFIAPALEGFRLDGDLYGIPYGAESIALWVNTDLAGVDPPASFAALLDICDGLSLDVVCLAVAGGAGIPEAYYQYPFLTGYGGSIFRYEDAFGYVADRAGIDEPEAVAASVFLAALDRGDYLPALDYVTAKQRFIEGEVAFWLTGYWEAEAIDEATRARGFSTAVIPVPPIDGLEARPFIESVGLFLGAGASTETKIFMTDWLATGEAMIAVGSGAAAVPCARRAGIPGHRRSSPPVSRRNARGRANSKPLGDDGRSLGGVGFGVDGHS